MNSVREVISGTDDASGDDHVLDTATTHSQMTSQEAYSTADAPLTETVTTPSTSVDDQVSVARLDGQTSTLVSVTGGGSANTGNGSVDVTTSPNGTLTIVCTTGAVTNWTYQIMADGSVDKVFATPPATLYHIYGFDPNSGTYVDTTTSDPGSVFPPTPAPRDWFQSVSDFSAAMGDTVSCGLTQRVRQGLGYDDVVDYNSRAYSTGVVAGNAVNVGLAFANPCGATRAGG